MNLNQYTLDEFFKLLLGVNKGVKLSWKWILFLRLWLSNERNSQLNLWTSLEDKNRQHQMSHTKFFHKPGRSLQIYFWVLNERDRKISKLKFLSKLFHVLCINLDLFFREHVEQQDKSFLHFLSVICHAMHTHTNFFLLAQLDKLISCTRSHFQQSALCTSPTLFF